MLFWLCFYSLKYFIYFIVYKVEVITGNNRGSGTDAHVFLTMYGDHSNTRRVQLVNR